jgi:hypothetical protein
MNPSKGTPSRSAIDWTIGSDQATADDPLDCSWTSQKSLAQSLRGFQRNAAALSNSSGHGPGSPVLSPPPSHCRFSPEHNTGFGATFRRAAGKSMMQKNDPHSRSLPSLPSNSTSGPKGSKLRLGTDFGMSQHKVPAHSGGDSGLLCVRPLMGWLQRPRAKSPPIESH